MLPFSQPTFKQVLAKAAAHLHFSPVKPYCFRRGAHTNCYRANEEGIVTFSPRTLKTIGNHALTYHENYVSVDLVELAKSFAKLKKIRIENFADSLCPSLNSRFISAISSINVQRAADSLVSRIPVCFSALIYPILLQAPLVNSHLDAVDAQKHLHRTNQARDKKYFKRNLVDMLQWNLLTPKLYSRDFSQFKLKFFLY